MEKLTGKVKGETLRGKINVLKTIHGYSAFEVAVINGFQGTEEEWLESLKGDKGDKGDPGYTPQKGVDYFDGEQGIQGIQGIPGEKGDTGAKGDKGETGATGEKGATGDTGKSAYQLAVDHGFQGTEREWIESLKGYSRLVVFTEHTFSSIAPGSTKYLTGSRDLVEGETYHVIWGNEEYTCVAFMSDSGEWIRLGNYHIIDADYPDNGLPFYIGTNPRDTYLYVQSAETHTDFYMCIFQENKINGLPDVTDEDNGKILQVIDGEWVAATGGSGSPGQDGKDGADGKSAYQIAQEHGFEGTEEEWLESLKGEGGSTITTLMEEQTIDGFAPFESYGGLYTAGRNFPESGNTNSLVDSFTLIVGETYIVEWDGVEYECVAQDVSVLAPGAVGLGNGVAFGLSGNNEPFVAGMTAGQGVTFISLTETVTSHTIGIYQGAKQLTKSDVVAIVNQVIEEALGGEY